MAANAYLDRMRELEDKRVSRNSQELETASGLPIQRPQNQQPPSNVPTGQSPKPEDDESYKQSLFYQHMDNFQQNDPHFGGVMKELTELATGLREQVKQGFMPEPIAQERLKQFVADTSDQYNRNAPRLQQEAKEQAQAKMIEGLIGKYANMPQQPQQMPNEGVTADDAAQMQGGQ